MTVKVTKLDRLIESKGIQTCKTLVDLYMFQWLIAYK